MVRTDVIIEKETGRVLIYRVNDVYVLSEDVDIVSYEGLEPILTSDYKGNMYIVQGKFLLSQGINSLDESDEDDFDD